MTDKQFQMLKNLTTRMEYRVGKMIHLSPIVYWTITFQKENGALKQIENFLFSG